MLFDAFRTQLSPKSTSYTVVDADDGRKWSWKCAGKAAQDHAGVVEHTAAQDTVKATTSGQSAAGKVACKVSYTLETTGPEFAERLAVVLGVQQGKASKVA